MDPSQALFRRRFRNNPSSRHIMHRICDRHDISRYRAVDTAIAAARRIGFRQTATRASDGNTPRGLMRIKGSGTRKVGYCRLSAIAAARRRLDD
jgi:hypothetical protein